MQNVGFSQSVELTHFNNWWLIKDERKFRPVNVKGIWKDLIFIFHRANWTNFIRWCAWFIRGWFLIIYNGEVWWKWLEMSHDFFFHFSCTILFHLIQILFAFFTFISFNFNMLCKTNCKSISFHFWNFVWLNWSWRFRSNENCRILCVW